MTAFGQPLFDFQGSLDVLSLAGFCADVFISEVHHLPGSGLLDETYNSVFCCTHIWITPERGYSCYYINVSVAVPGYWPGASLPPPRGPHPFP